MDKNFAVNLKSAGQVVETKSNGQEQYINLNCYIQKPGDEKPEWLFRVSCVKETRSATENVLSKLAKDFLSNMKKRKVLNEETGEIEIQNSDEPLPITFTFIEGNMKKEKEEMETFF